MSTTYKFDKYEEDIPLDQRLYKSMIGSFLYLTVSMSDIMLSVCLCARFQASPMELHLKVVKKIIKYVKHTTNFGLWYLKQTHFDLCAYTDSDFAGSKSDGKSTSGACFFLGSCFLSWMCKKQSSISLSTTEAEYILARLRHAQIFWMQLTLINFGLEMKHSPL